MQYTIRRIPRTLDAALREQARARRKSLNETVIEALIEGTGLTGAPAKRRSLAQVAGTWKADRAIQTALADQDRVDKGLWR